MYPVEFTSSILELAAKQWARLRHRARERQSEHQRRSQHRFSHRLPYLRWRHFIQNSVNRDRRGCGWLPPKLNLRIVCVRHRWWQQGVRVCLCIYMLCSLSLLVAVCVSECVFERERKEREKKKRKCLCVVMCLLNHLCRPLYHPVR